MVLAVDSFDAYNAGGWGVNVSSGDLDADGRDEVLTGRGPGPGYDSRVRGYDVDFASSPQLVADFDAFASGTWGTNVGSANVTGDIRDEILVGKGPGDQSKCAEGMDTRVRLFEYDGVEWKGRLLFEALPALDARMSTCVASAQMQCTNTMSGNCWFKPGEAGARPDGIGDLDGDGYDEIAVSRGPAHHNVTTPGNQYLDGFRGSSIGAWTVDDAPWAVSALTFWDTLTSFGDYEPDYIGPSTIGGRLARINSYPLEYLVPVDGGVGPAIELRTAGDASYLPRVMPWLSSQELAERSLRYLAQGGDLYASDSARDDILVRLREVADSLRTGELSRARQLVAILIDVAAGYDHRRAFHHEMVGQLVTLEESIRRELGNRSPVIVLDGSFRDRVVPFGGAVRLRLSVDRSSDADSTPGTVDNIRHYRWLGSGGALLGEEPVIDVELGHGPDGISSHAITVEIEDAYGAVSTERRTIAVIGTRD